MMKLSEKQLELVQAALESHLDWLDTLHSENDIEAEIDSALLLQAKIGRVLGS